MKRYILYILLLLPGSLLAQSYTTPVQVNMGGGGLADRSPMMKLDHKGNIYIAWVRGADGMGNGPIAMSVSTDGGSTFSMPSVVCADANCNANFQRTAQFVIDTKDNIHLVWMGSRVNSQPDIWYTRSMDKGKTWSKPVTVCDANDSSKYAQDFPTIACDSSDNLYVSFLDSRMTQRKIAKTPLLYFTRSTDGGMTWSVNKRADVPPGGMGGTCECCTEQMASTADGHIYIVFRSNINNLRDIWLARSYDKGMTFQPALKIVSGDWNIDACPVTGPHITLDDAEGAHIVWRDARDDSGKVRLYYAYVPNGSTATPVNTAFDADGAQQANYPDIALYDHAKFRVIAYETFNYGMRYILYNNTTNSALVNNRPVNVNGNSAKSFTNVLFADDGTRYLCWQDTKNDAGDIYFAKENSKLPSGISDSLPGKVMLLSPLPNAVVSVPVTLTWEKMDKALSYHVQVYPKMDSEPSYIPVYDSTGITTTSITVSLKAQQIDFRYSWNVSAINGEGEGTKSSQEFLTAKSSVSEKKESTFSIYPNLVSKDNPTIRIERGSNSPATMTLIDLLGREIASFTLGTDGSKVITLPNLTAGIYYFILNNGLAAKKIIIR